MAARQKVGGLLGNKQEGSRQAIGWSLTWQYTAQRSVPGRPQPVTGALHGCPQLAESQRPDVVEVGRPHQRSEQLTLLYTGDVARQLLQVTWKHIWVSFPRTGINPDFKF